MHSAVSEWSNILGSEFVITDEGILGAAGRSTFGSDRKITAIIYPSTREEVQECVKVSNRMKIPIYPVSTGKNWGYGSAVPPQSGCVVMNLSRLNNIVDYDETLGYVTVEPGVTQGQLFEFLCAQKSKFWMDATGSSRDCSIIGNVLERGFGHTEYGDHFSHSCGMEVVLPTGDYFSTGFWGFENARAGSVYKWGLGPYIDGLFTQSNLGIVTRLTVWLMPKPEAFLAFNFSVDDDQGLESLLEGLRQLRMEGTIRSTVHIGDNYKVLSSIQQYPWAEMEGRTPLSKELLWAYQKRWRFGAWNGSGGLYGTKRQVKASKARIKKVLKGRVNQLKFVSDGVLNLIPYIAKPYERITGINLNELIKLIRPAYGLLKGVPTNDFLASAYWRKRGGVPGEIDLDRDRCGLIWCTPVTPNNPILVRRMINIIREVFSTSQFEPAMSMTMINERSLENVISISYDQAVHGEDERAKSLHRELVDRLVEEGYYPYRLTIDDMGLIQSNAASLHRVLKKIKRALDPEDVLSPGRYI